MSSDVAPLEETTEYANYFITYSFLYHQKQMLEDHVRMVSYRVIARLAQSPLVHGIRERIKIGRRRDGTEPHGCCLTTGHFLCPIGAELTALCHCRAPIRRRTPSSGIARSLRGRWCSTWARARVCSPFGRLRPARAKSMPVGAPMLAQPRPGSTCARAPSCAPLTTKRCAPRDNMLCSRGD